MIKHFKYEQLMIHLKEMDNVAIAFSGGVDSTFLIKAAKEALGERVLALTVDTPYMPRWELSEASALAKHMGVVQKVITLPIPEEIRKNPENRCYLCKYHLFSRLRKEAEKAGVDHLLDGTNHDDTLDYRPGLKALSQLQVKSPLKELGITKKEIRAFSKALGLVTWNKPAYACLLTRIPHDTPIEAEELNRIEQAEKCFLEQGFKAIRVRSHGLLARIEIPPHEIASFIQEENRSGIIMKLKRLGYRYVTLDMEGYRTGSMNEAEKSGAAE
jgi:pyridinium-3,5-biscarboxylic acid mononucleotide sulfurtransferase